MRDQIPLCDAAATYHADSLHLAQSNLPPRAELELGNADATREEGVHEAALPAAGDIQPLLGKLDGLVPMAKKFRNPTLLVLLWQADGHSANLTSMQVDDRISLTPRRFLLPRGSRVYCMSEKPRVLTVVPENHGITTHDRRAVSKPSHGLPDVFPRFARRCYDDIPIPQGCRTVCNTRIHR